MSLWNITDFKEHTAIITTGGTTFSYNELDVFQKQLARQMEAHSLVFFVMENEPKV